MDVYESLPNLPKTKDLDFDYHSHTLLQVDSIHPSAWQPLFGHRRACCRSWPVWVYDSQEASGQRSSSRSSFSCSLAIRSSSRHHVSLFGSLQQVTQPVAQLGTPEPLLLELGALRLK